MSEWLLPGPGYRCASGLSLQASPVFTRSALFSRLHEEKVSVRVMQFTEDVEM